MPPLFVIPSFFAGGYTPQQPENCCCGPSGNVNVNVNTAPPIASQIFNPDGTVSRRTDEAGRLIAQAAAEGIWLFQGV